MTNELMLYLSLILFFISSTNENHSFRCTGFFISFCILALAISGNITQSFIAIVITIPLHMILMLGAKEYNKNKWLLYKT